MADDEIATRAPESDARVEPSSLSSQDTKAQTGSAIGEHCVTSAPLNTAQSPNGDITELNGIPTYISKPPSYPSEPSKLLILLTGGTGLHSRNNQHQADLFAARGFVVVMPDQFSADPAPNTALQSPTVAEAAADEDGVSGILEKVKMGAVETAKSFLIDMWLARQTPEKVLPAVLKVLESARETFADAVANGGGVYGVGYCVGAKYLLRLLAARTSQDSTKEDEEKLAATEPELKCGAIAHGALITKEDLQMIRKPIAIVGVAQDSLFPDDMREQGKAALELNSIEHDVRVFEGVPHGFAVVGDYGEAVIQQKQEEAFSMMASWLETH
ncbi:MAG: hypothetical protein Q9159_000985 [Coniocarpon cinnabarinum]